MESLNLQWKSEENQGSMGRILSYKTCICYMYIDYMLEVWDRIGVWDLQRPQRDYIPVQSLKSMLAIPLLPLLLLYNLW